MRRPEADRIATLLALVDQFEKTVSGADRRGSSANQLALRRGFGKLDGLVGPQIGDQ